MKKNCFIFLLCIAYFPIVTHSQKPVFDLFSPSTVLLKYSNGASASGIIVADSNYMFLITARHCLISNIKSDKIVPIDTSLLIIHYPKDPFGDKPDSILINTAEALREKDLLYDSVHDIAIISIAKIVSGFPKNLKLIPSVGVRKLTHNIPRGIANDLLLPFAQVLVSDDCLILGYPSSLQLNSINDYNFNRPLLRKGAIAGKDKEKETIIVDCPSYQGNSGGPVFAFSYISKREGYGLIGIVSRSILHVEQLESSYYRTTVSVNYANSGYTVVIPIEHAIALMTKRSKTGY